jgi:putative FmdB family regulatory protein
MPIYEYKCDNGHLFEVIQKMSDEPVTQCEECGAPVIRVLHSPAVHFKGSGFYNTDYGKKKGAAAGVSEGGNGSSSSEGTADSKPSESSSEAKPGDSKDTAKTTD